MTGPENLQLFCRYTFTVYIRKFHRLQKHTMNWMPTTKKKLCCLNSLMPTGRSCGTKHLQKGTMRGREMMKAHIICSNN